MIGKLPIIVELGSANAEGRFIGRYAYLSEGVDIPLHGTTDAGAGSLKLAEEKPCTQALCGGDTESPPIAALWKLTPESNGERLAGTWHDNESGKTLTISIERKDTRIIGSRVDDFDALDPRSVEGSGNPGVLTAKDLPYDFLKMERPLKSGDSIKFGESVYRKDSDARIGLSYPVITAFGGEDPAPLNVYLAQQRLQFVLPAYGCLMSAYFSFGWRAGEVEVSRGYDDDTRVVIDHLTPRLMGLTESGSYYCGGPHPHRFLDHRIVDADTGKPILPQALLRGWIAKNDDGVVVDPARVADRSQLTFGPSDELVNFINDRRQKFDAEFEAEYSVEGLLRSYLGVYVTEDELVFCLTDLPEAMSSYNGDLVRVPLKDARSLLTQGAAKYFEVLTPNASK
jgi:hypothetical protein